MLTYILFFSTLLSLIGYSALWIISLRYRSLPVRVKYQKVENANKGILVWDPKTGSYRFIPE